MNKINRVGFYFGDFQPINKEEYRAIEQMLDENDQVVLLAYNENNSISYKRPFSYFHMTQMIKKCFSFEDTSRIVIVNATIDPFNMTFEESMHKVLKDNFFSITNFLEQVDLVLYHYENEPSIFNHDFYQKNFKHVLMKPLSYGDVCDNDFISEKQKNKDIRSMTDVFFDQNSNQFHEIYPEVVISYIQDKYISDKDNFFKKLNAERDTYLNSLIIKEDTRLLIGSKHYVILKQNDSERGFHSLEIPSFIDIDNSFIHNELILEKDIKLTPTVYPNKTKLSEHIESTQIIKVPVTDDFIDTVNSKLPYMSDRSRSLTIIDIRDLYGQKQNLFSDHWYLIFEVMKEFRKSEAI